MLAYEFFIMRQSPSWQTIGRWITKDIDWILHMLAQGMATKHGGNGYPDKYEITAGALLAAYETGIVIDRPMAPAPRLPNRAGPEDIDIDLLMSLERDEILYVEAWDQS